MKPHVRRIMMSHPPFARAALIIVLLAAPPAGAQPASEPTLRVRGVIDKDQTWSGLVWITDDTRIEQATVRVAGGTTIEFARGAPGENPKLTVGTAGGRGGRLILDSTADRPITIRTRAGTQNGRLVVHAGGKDARAGDDRIEWKHVSFDGLGYAASRGTAATKVRVQEPAILFRLIGAARGVALTDCVFRRAGRVEIYAPQGAEAAVRRCRFAEPQERISLDIHGGDASGAAPRVAISENVLAATLTINGRSSRIEGNILIGPDAAIALDRDASDKTCIVGNYVHNTTPQDDGRYCLKCENPSALVERNIFRGATTCVLGGSKRMSGNLIIAAPRLASRTVRTARTHALVQGLPNGALFENNVLLGPAHSLLVPQLSTAARAGDSPGEPIVIRQNVFDGLVESNRAIQLNAAGAAPAKVAVYNNIVLRLPCLIFDAARSDNTLTYANYNAVAPPAPRAYDQARLPGGATCGANDLKGADASALRLAQAPPAEAPNHDEALLAGKAVIEDIRRGVFAVYAPISGSLLTDSGRPDAPGDAPRIIGPISGPAR